MEGSLRPLPPKPPTVIGPAGFLPPGASTSVIPPGLSRASVFLLPRKLGHLGGASPHASLDSRAPSWAPLFCVTWGSPSASELRNPSRGVPRPRPRGTARAAVLCVQRLRTCLRGGPERTPFSSATGSLLLGLSGSVIAPPGVEMSTQTFPCLLHFQRFGAFPRPPPKGLGDCPPLVPSSSRAASSFSSAFSSSPVPSCAL